MRPSTSLRVALLLLCAAPAIAGAQDATLSSPAAGSTISPRRTEARIGLQAESLSNGAGDWHDASFEITGQPGPRRRWSASLHELRRFSLRDDLFTAAYVHPITSRAVVSIEAQGSVSHQVVPRIALSGRVDARVGRGWVVNAGVAERRYDTGAVRLLSAGVERYVSRYRFAYTAYGAFLPGAGESLSHAAAVDRYYGGGDHSVIGVTLATGRELEQDIRTGLRASRVRALSARGRHWMGPRVGVFYTVGVHEQGSLYTRRGGSAGIAFRF